MGAALDFFKIANFSFALPAAAMGAIMSPEDRWQGAGRGLFMGLGADIGTSLGRGAAQGIQQHQTGTPYNANTSSPYPTFAGSAIGGIAGAYAGDMLFDAAQARRNARIKREYQEIMNREQQALQ